MKKTLLKQFAFLLFALLFAWQTARADGGATCATATTATSGTNHSTHTGTSDVQWFTYTPGTDCLLTISSCGLTTSGNSCDIVDNCTNQYTQYSSSLCGNSAPYQSKLTFWATSGQSYLIRWNSFGAAASYDWTITETPLPAGSTSATAITAVEGVNNTYHYGRLVDQWYTYTANADGILKIAPVAGQNSFDGVNLYNAIDISSSIGEFASNGGEIKVTNGGTYYLHFNTNNQDNYAWMLSFTPQAPVAGDACSLPIAAAPGINNASNVTGNQWFSFTPAENGVMTITTCGLTTEDTYVEIYGDCASSYLSDCDDYCGLQTTVVMDVVKDKTYLIKWKNEYTSGTFPWSLSLRPYSNATDIKSFSFNGETVSSTVDAATHTVNVAVGKNQALTGLTATFELSEYATANIGTVSQVSESTANDFTSTVTYTITAENGTTQDWAVNVTNASVLISDKAILSYAFTDLSYIDSTVVDAVHHTVKAYAVYNIPDVTSLVANFTLSNYAAAGIGTTPQVSGSTANDFTGSKTYTITAEDATTQDWTVEVIINAKPKGESCADPITAVEGVNYTNKAFIDQYYVYTPSETGYISLGYWDTNSKLVRVYSDCPNTNIIGSSWVSNGNELKVLVEKDVPVYIRWQNIKSDSWTLTQYDAQSGKDITSFNVQSSVNLPVIDTTNHTINAVVGLSADLSNLYTNFSLSYGAKAFIGATQVISGNYIDFTNPVTLTIKAQDGTSQDYVVTVIKRELGTGNSITSFHLIEQTGQVIIDNTNHTVKMGVVTGTNLTALIPRFNLSDYAAAVIGTAVQVSNKSVVDFTSPVTYTITSESGVAQNWTVTVTVGAVQNSFADITSFRVNEQTQAVTIDAANKTVTVIVAPGTDRSALVPTFYTSSGATTKVGLTDQVSGTTANNFTAPVVYTVTSEDGLTTLNWTVTVKNTETAITAFALAGQTSATIDAVNKTISVAMPYGATVTALVGTFTVSVGATVKVGTVAQVSGTTANDFTSPVVYAVLAEDGVTSQNWTVTVMVAKNSATEISSFSLAGQTSATIDAVNKTIAVAMPYGTTVTALVGTFTASAGATVKVGTIAQVSGTTANDFTSPVVYAVLAEDGVTTQNWTVTVNVATGIATINGTKVSIYPNPVIDIVNITTGNTGDNGTYTILSVSGIVMAHGVIANGKAEANIEGLSSGLYMVQVQIGTQKASYRIIKR